MRDSSAGADATTTHDEKSLVGAGTAELADNPLLTDRSGLSRRRPLLRVIVDSHLRLPLESRIVKTANNDVLVFSSFAEEKRKQQLQNHGIQVEQVASAGADCRPDLKQSAGAWASVKSAAL